MTNGSRWLGCYFAKAKDCVLNQRRPFQPLAPIEFTCVGRGSPGSYYVDRPPIKLTSPFRAGTRTPITNAGFRAWHMIDADPSGIGTELEYHQRCCCCSGHGYSLDMRYRATGKVRVAYATRPPVWAGHGKLILINTYRMKCSEYDPQVHPVAGREYSGADRQNPIRWKTGLLPFP